jgi:hypothetical protein
MFYTHNGTLFAIKNEIMSFVGKRMELENNHVKWNKPDWERQIDMLSPICGI